MTIELLDTEEAQTEDPVEVQVSLFLSSTTLTLPHWGILGRYTTPEPLSSLLYSALFTFLY